MLRSNISLKSSNPISTDEHIFYVDPCSTEHHISYNLRHHLQFQEKIYDTLEGYNLTPTTMNVTGIIKIQFKTDNGITI